MGLWLRKRSRSADDVKTSGSTLALLLHDGMCATVVNTVLTSFRLLLLPLTQHNNHTSCHQSVPVANNHDNQFRCLPPAHPLPHSSPTRTWKNDSSLSKMFFSHRHYCVVATHSRNLPQRTEHLRFEMFGDWYLSAGRHEAGVTRDCWAERPPQL